MLNLRDPRFRLFNVLCSSVVWLYFGITHGFVYSQVRTLSMLIQINIDSHDTSIINVLLPGTQFYRSSIRSVPIGERKITPHVGRTSVDKVGGRSAVF